MPSLGQTDLAVIGVQACPVPRYPPRGPRCVYIRRRQRYKGVCRPLDYIRTALHVCISDGGQRYCGVCVYIRCVYPYVYPMAASTSAACVYPTPDIAIVACVDSISDGGQHELCMLRGDNIDLQHTGLPHTAPRSMAKLIGSQMYAWVVSVAV